MLAEVIAIGNEVVDGSVINTNASWLSQELSRYGVEVKFHSAIPDDETLMLDAFKTAYDRVDLVLVCGGLGPTVDDFTLEVAAKFFHQPLIEDELALKRLTKFFQKMGRIMTPNQASQALVPSGSTVLHNQVGTAVGIYQVHGDRHFGFFPGVPQELKMMFQKQFLPILLKLPNRGCFRVMKVLRCFGLPEGQMDHQLRQEIKGRVAILGADLGFRVRFPFIDIRLYGNAANELEAVKRAEEASQIVRDKLGDYIFAEGETSLPAVVGRLLSQQRRTLASAESCTGGLLADWMTDVPGASEYFLEGVVSYSNASKIDLLAVSEQTLNKHGAVSASTALEMARGIQKRAQSDFGVALTGIAGPTGGNESKPVGTVHIAVIHPEGEWNEKFLFPFDRLRFKQLAAAAALDKIRKLLLDFKKAD